MNRFANRWSTHPMLGVVLVVLIVLAGLQYHWLNRLSEGEQARLEDRLQTAATRFSEGFMGTFSQARTLFQVPVETSQLPEADLHRGYHQWQNLAATPELIDAIYWVQPAADSATVLYQLDPQGGRLHVTNWPEALLPWKQILTPSSPNSQVVQLAPRLELDPYPVLMLPGSSSWSVMPLGGRMHIGYVLLVLNPEVLRKRYIPDLIARHIPDAADYHLAVRKTDDPAQVLYASAPSLSEAVFAHPDVAVTLRSDTLRHQVMVSMVLDVDRDSVQMQAVTRDNVPWAVTMDSTVQSTGFSYSYSTDTGMYVVGRGPSRTANSLSIDRVLNRRVRTPLHGGSGTWELVATHRSGSLQAAVRKARWRNLALSFGLMLVLAGSAILLVVSARRAQQLGQQQMEFVAGVSHELRTPLAVIHAAGENLADGVVEDAGQARQYGQLIRDEGRRLSRMVEQTLALARIGTGQRSATLTPISIEKVLESALGTHQSLMDAEGIDLEVHMASDLTLVRADAPALQSAIENLIHNAVKYSVGSGRIIVRAERVGKEVHISVQDFGMGIGPDEQPRLFEPFYRAPAVVEAQMEGSGIGLSLVRHVMEAHHGRVSVQSAPGEGSTFTLHLPILEDA